eukprot:CAMPEP_0179081782 /NCGR_PEP_ID=MMETSP0796-20121207/36841_1 /TAXON_ID=73915 /ORGANISM="Pyrodinium bahamense, Strain pbaha01" /LENGTH=117 /DNA_ID=CAMNT_0020779171 /DNA_START=153 /DNA_END=504 /DNA_ORIENTATION=-
MPALHRDEAVPPRILHRGLLPYANALRPGGLQQSGVFAVIVPVGRPQVVGCVWSCASNDGAHPVALKSSTKTLLAADRKVDVQLAELPGRACAGRAKLGAERLLSELADGADRAVAA